MKLDKTDIDHYKLYLWDEGKPEPKGIEGSAVVLPHAKMIELAQLLRANGF